MALLKRKTKIQALPDGYNVGDIKTESSICTGETIIGFKKEHENRLSYAELVKSDADIDAFYAKYGLKR